MNNSKFIRYPCLNKRILIEIIRTTTLMALFSALISCSDSQTIPRLTQDAIILSFGDSLTRGKGASEAQSYPAILQQLSGRQVVNAGINGELSEQGLRRLPELLDRHQPELLILCHGGNDILRQRDMQQLAHNLKEMIRHARDRNIPVIMLGVPRFGLFLSTADVYRDVATSTGVIFVEDTITEVLGDSSLKSDTVHPNGDGYHIIAESIYSVLQDSGAL
jgi:lysophospholipase L1-like esterase